MTGIDRFVEAQDAGGAFEAALGEMRDGQKRGHWIWFVFPQLSGLGTSEMARTYALRDEDEALAYLRHPVLQSRLLAITTAAAGHLARGVALIDLMGSAIDAAKLVSSMTLCAKVAGRLHTETGEAAYGTLATAATDILAAAENQGYPACRHTLACLES